MNPNRSNPYQLQFSGIGFWLGLFAIFWLLGAIGLGWLINSLLILFGLILIAPILLFVGARWWLNRNLVQDQCPVCSYEFAGLNNTQLACPSCGEPVQVEAGQFQRLTPPGTIDVDVVDVSAQSVDE